MQQQAHRAGLAEGRHPLPRPREPLVEGRQRHAVLVQAPLRPAELTHELLTPRRQLVVRCREPQQHLARALRFTLDGGPKPGGLGASLVRQLGRIEAAQGGGRGVELVELFLQARHIARGQLSLLRQERPLRIVGDQLPLERDRTVLHMQPAGREQRPAGISLHRARIRGHRNAQVSFDSGGFLGKLRQGFAYLAPARRAPERLRVRFRQP